MALSQNDAGAIFLVQAPNLVWPRQIAQWAHGQNSLGYPSHAKERDEQNSNNKGFTSMVC